MKQIITILFFSFFICANQSIAQISLPLDFELDPASYDFVGFEGADSAIEGNPDMNGNTSATVMRTIKTEGAQFFAGTFVNLDEAIDFSASNNISIDAWSPKANIPIRLALENQNTGNQIFVDQNVVSANGWETLNFDFSGLIDPNVEYTRVVVFFEFIEGLAGDGSTYFFDNVLVEAPPAPLIVLPIDFELGADAYNFLGFEGADSAIEANPDMNGNTSAAVMRTTKTVGAQFFAGTLIAVDEAIDFSTTSIISMDAWSPKAGIPIRFALENSVTGNQIFVDQNIVGANAWETLNFDFAGLIDPNIDYDRVVVFFEFVEGLAGDGSTYFLDNIAVATPPMVNIGLPLDFELGADEYDFSGFEGADSAIVPNPDMNGNTSATVMQSIKAEGAQFFAGTFVNLTETIDFSSSNTISMDVLSLKEGIPVRLRLENADNSVGIELDQTVLGSNTWETLTYDFSSMVDPTVEFVRVIVFFEFVPNLPGDGSTYFFDNIAVAAPPAVSISLPLDFELGADAYDFLGFEGADSAIEANPDMSGINASATVMRTIKTEGAQFFAGTFINLDESIDFSNSNVITIDSWSPKADIPVRLRLENADNSVGVELDANTVNASTWETLSYDFSSMIDPEVDFVRVIVFFEFDPNLPGDGTTYFFDNVGIAAPPAASIALPLDFELGPDAYDFLGFEGANSAIEVNPDMSGVNPSATVMRTTKEEGAQFFAGTLINLNEPIIYNEGSVIDIDSWSPKAGIPVRLRLENADNSVGVELDVNTVTANTWETLTYNFGSMIDPAVDFVRVVIFFEFDPNLPGDGTTYFFDNIEVNDVASTSNVKIADLAITPNPTNDFWNIRTDTQIINSITLFDYSGRKVLFEKINSNSFSIPAANLVPGFYMASLITDEGQQTIKLIRQ